MNELLIGFVTGGALAALIKALADRFAWKRKRRADKEDNVERKKEEAKRQASLKTEQRLECIEDTIGALKEGMKFMLYDRIRYLGQEYIAEKAIDFDDRRILNNMHHTYHNGLSGNGDLDTLMEEVNHLPLKMR